VPFIQEIDIITRRHTQPSYKPDSSPYVALVSKSIDRVHTRDLSVQQFIDRYERPNKPVMIEGLSDHWKAHQKWSFHALATGEVPARLSVLPCPLSHCRSLHSHDPYLID
jgi:hypothetical protein